ncbi:MAG: MBL fold metallo-hydrolase [Candidatus Hydrogenedentes bacterium]|nr:MBL fold metallo-hydrolase [Candidatus Hydrogenedentota bacterium]
MPEPKKAAVCIVRRASGEILMARRNLAMRFMAGQHVFPGGRIDDNESTARVVGDLEETHAQAIHAAVRETFEETGILTVRGALPRPGDVEQARSDLLSERATFEDVLDRFDLTIHAEDFENAGHWITPKESPIRFDTRYFLYHLQSDQQEVLREGEMIGLDWLHPLEARRRWQSGTLQMSSPVAHTLRLMDAAPYPDFLELLRHASDRRHDVANRAEILRGIHIIPLESSTIPPATHTNCLLIGEEEIIVIDPGTDDAAQLAFLKEQIDHLIDLGGTVKSVVLTHSHIDHVAGAAFVRDTYSIPIWAHEATAQQCDFPIDRTLEHDEVLTLSGDPGWRLRAIHTPGHDPGHLCFLEETTHALICGDMMANPGTIVVSQQYRGDMTDFIESLERLQRLPSTLILPGHGLPMENPQEKIAEHLEHRLWRERKIQDALAQEPGNFLELLATAYDDAPKEAMPLAEHSLRAHLSRLGVDVPD